MWRGKRTGDGEHASQAGGGGHTDGRHSGGYQTYGRRGDRRDPRKTGHRVHEVGVEEPKEGTSETRSESEKEENRSDPESEVPEELVDSLGEATAYLTQAKKRRAEVEKARGFFKKGADTKGKEEHLAQLNMRSTAS